MVSRSMDQSLYSTWDNQFDPDGVPGAEVMANASPNGGLELAKGYWVSFPEGYRCTRFGLRAATARRIRPAIHRFELQRSGLDTRRALAGCCRERPLSRGEPRNGWPRGFSWVHGKEFTRSRCGALAPYGRSPAGGVVVILPFALLAALVEWQQQLRIGASLLVMAFVFFWFVNRRHPRALARIPPTQLGLWSFAVAIAHGAGLMLVPIYLDFAGPPTSTGVTRRQAPS